MDQCQVQKRRLPRRVRDRGRLLHVAAIHLLRRLRVRDREIVLGLRSFPRCRSWCLAPAILGASLRMPSKYVPEMSRIVAGLERAGLVKRRKTEAGGECVWTPARKATKILQEGRKRRVESLAKAVYALSDKEAEPVGPARGAPATVISKSVGACARIGIFQTQDRA